MGPGIWRLYLGHVFWIFFVKTCREALILTQDGRLMALSDHNISTAFGDWEFLWAPYDAPTYQAVLEQLQSDDIVLEIGAGDLRLARKMAAVTCKVYGIEINASVLYQGLKNDETLPPNLIATQADARAEKFPSDVSVGVILMRHCTHLMIYAEKLREIGCQKLITNARWHLGVETIDLQAPRIRYEQVKVGRFACWCGAVGFKIGSVDLLTSETEAIIHEVSNCPACSNVSKQ